ncbi:MAG TPA: uracil-DNA glycosylase [Lachnospiraceae bacterium]|nr:uracil-DNA glycosylase [Lachnospiraceae bacterium]
MGAINNDWLEKLNPEFKKPYYARLYKLVSEEYAKYQVFPPQGDILNAFHYTPLHQVRVVIIGQDPYHEPGEAHGLSFSVQPGVKIPPSLLNIYQELHEDLGCYVPDNGCLTKWARQGVLLLNSVLTVRAHQAFSHANFGWQTFTDAAIRAVNQEDRPIAFLLWGRSAQEKSSILDNPKHLILKSAHPSPLSAYRGFFGSRPFSKVNHFLEAAGEPPIDWQIENIGCRPVEPKLQSSHKY